jgi:hypothetical protein
VSGGISSELVSEGANGSEVPTFVVDEMVALRGEEGCGLAGMGNERLGGRWIVSSAETF